MKQIYNRKINTIKFSSCASVLHSFADGHKILVVILLLLTNLGFNPLFNICSSSKNLKTVHLLDALQLLMLFAERLTYMEPKAIVLII
jgi:hypothetical protein